MRRRPQAFRPGEAHPEEAHPAGARPAGPRPTMTRRALPLLTAGLLLLAGCPSTDPDDRGREGETESAETADPARAAVEVGSFVPRGTSGELMVTRDGARFRECGGAEWRTIRDGTADRSAADTTPPDPEGAPDPAGDLARIARELGPGPATLPAHLVFDDSGDRVTQVRVVLPEGAGCPDVLPDTELQARGNEPFWGVDMEGTEARFRTPERIDGVVFDGGRWAQVAPRVWRFEAGELEVEITEERCRDSMSAAWYPFSARVRVGEDEYTGCALEGRRAHGH